MKCKCGHDSKFHSTLMCYGADRGKCECPKFSCGNCADLSLRLEIAEEALERIRTQSDYMSRTAKMAFAWGEVFATSIEALAKIREAGK